MVRMVGSGVKDNPMEAVGANLPHKCTSAGYIVMIALDVAGDDDDDDDDVAPPRMLLTSFRVTTVGVLGVTRNPLHIVKRNANVQIQFNSFLFFVGVMMVLDLSLTLFSFNTIWVPYR